MTVASVEGIPVSVPGDTGLRRETADTFDHVLVRVETDRGTVGWGEVPCMPSWPSGLTQEASLALVAELAPVVEGRRLANLEAIVRDMERALARSPFPVAGIEVALHDALGRHYGVPVADLLGGFNRPDRTIDLHASIPPGSIEQVRATATEAAEAGFPGVKVKVGTGDHEADRRTIETVRDVLPTAEIRVDANGAWTVTEAVRALRDLTDVAGEIAYAEQPVAPGHPESLARLRRAVPAPIVADESCFSPTDVHALATAEAVDAVSIKLAKAGGLRRARDVAIVAEAAGIGGLVGGMLELGIGTAASAHFAAAAPNLQFSTGIFAHHAATALLGNDEVWTPRGPTFTVPDRPGLGIQVDSEALERYRTD
ncbi:MAG: mandelate racemase/muconate lactonizing enzyme family protein [Halobacteriales archaeon]|nr:mandelate racemase/muconate lactonizing enzyme family protein [Halobacteriales archaeon]